MNNTFTGARVRLRAMEPRDVEQFVLDEIDRDTDRARADDQIYLPKGEWRVREGFADRMRREGQMETFRFMIENLEGQIVGSINAHDVDARNGTFSYGLGVYEPFRRRGYASEAVLLLMRFYFMELRMHKCNVEAWAFNDASIGLHEHLGFAREGLRRQVYFTHGRYWDDVLFGMTREEFIQKYPEFSQEG